MFNTRAMRRWIQALLLSSLVSSPIARGQSPAVSPPTPELYFNTLPSKQLFHRGEDVVVVLELYSVSDQPIFVSRLQGDDFVRFKVVGPDGSEVPWHGQALNGRQPYSASDFVVLRQYTAVSAKRIISLKDGGGFAFDKAGRYVITSEFFMGSPEKFGTFAGRAKIPPGALHSSKLAFCIEACMLEPLQVRDNAPHSALAAVRVFYNQVTKYHQLGIPHGRAKKALWPLLSKRLAQELDGFQGCDDDYYRRYGEILRANIYKPETPWLEEGLFTGPDDVAAPSTFRILSSRSVGENRVDVLIAFKRDWGEPEGDVTAILENGRWVIDDYVPMYNNWELWRLSAGYPQCKDGQWVGENPD